MLSADGWLALAAVATLAALAAVWAPTLLTGAKLLMTGRAKPVSASDLALPEAPRGP